MKKVFFVVALASLFLGGCAIVNWVQPDTNADKKTPAGDSAITENEKSAPTEDVSVPSSKKLDLSNQNLTKIPDSVFKQTNLQELDVSGNKLTGAIQAEIRHLQALRVLNASNNQMTGVPAEVGQLKNLEVLDLSNNQLTGLPYELGNLKNLKTLNLSGNNYSIIDLEVIMKSLPVGVNIIK